MKKSVSEMKNLFLQELNQLPLDFNPSKWWDEAEAKGIEIWIMYGRQNSSDSYSKAIFEAMLEHPLSTVSKSEAPDRIAQNVYFNILDIDRKNNPNSFRKHRNNQRDKAKAQLEKEGKEVNHETIYNEILYQVFN